MAGSIKQARKGLRPGKARTADVKGPQQGAGAQTKSMTAGQSRPASTWFKSTPIA